MNPNKSTTPSTALEQIAECEARIRALRAAALDELRERERKTLAALAEIRSQMSQLEGRPPTPPSRPPRVESAAARAPRARVTDDELTVAFRGLLAQRPLGVTKGELCERAGIGKPRFDLYVQRNPGSFKTTGQKAGLRYFLP